MIVSLFTAVAIALLCRREELSAPFPDAVLPDVHRRMAWFIIAIDGSLRFLDEEVSN
jgi:hypothetical protein